MARKPTISPTKIATYLACPVKYRWTYVDNRGRWYLKAKSYYSFGTTLHKALERFHDEGDHGVTTTAELLSAYDEGWIEAGYSSAEEMSEAYGEGLVLLEQYAEQELERSDEVKSLFVEKQLRHDMGEFILLGRLDRVDEYADGTIEAVDYKSGRESVSEEEVAHDIAMGVYQLLLKKKYPDRPVRARIIALRSGESAAASMSPVEMEEFEAAILQIGREITGEDYYERVPTLKGLCDRCDFKPLCAHDPSFA